MTDRTFLRLSAFLLLAGIVLSFVAGFLHPAHEKPNEHIAVFAEYAASTNWIAVHLGQFVGIAILIAGLVVLYYALDVRSGTPMWLARFGTVAAVITLALYAVLQAVDGVALKHAVDAWASAPDAENAARFASAEVIRWMEWAVRSYFSYMLGLSFVLFGAAMVLVARPSRVVGYLMGLSGLAYLVQGWIIGGEGFSDNNTIPTLLSYALILVWCIWLLVIAWRMNPSVEAPTGYAAT
jgi:hypothetical protein